MKVIIKSGSCVGLLKHSGIKNLKKEKFKTHFKKFSGKQIDQNTVLECSPGINPSTQVFT